MAKLVIKDLEFKNKALSNLQFHVEILDGKLSKIYSTDDLNEGIKELNSDEARLQFLHFKQGMTYKKFVTNPFNRGVFDFIRKELDRIFGHHNIINWELFYYELWEALCVSQDLED